MTPRLIEQRGELIAVDKPAGLSVHPAGGDVRDLLAWLDASEALPPGTRPVHRLDRGTSGVVLCGADPRARERASRWFAEGQVEKRYLALVIGKARQKGVIRRPLKDRGRPVQAVTRYRCVERLGGFSLLEVRPATGRKHQIRRHLHGIGLPVVGDGRYRPRRFRPVPGFPGRLWLHAWSLKTPEGGAFTAPLPPALEAHLEQLRQGAR